MEVAAYRLASGGIARSSAYKEKGFEIRANLEPLCEYRIPCALLPPQRQRRGRRREGIDRNIVIVPGHEGHVRPLADLRAARARECFVPQVTCAGEQTD